MKKNLVLIFSAALFFNACGREPVESPQAGAVNKPSGMPAQPPQQQTQTAQVPTPQPGESKSAAQAEKEKAMANPYPSDLGPATIDVSDYPAEMQEGYKLLQNRCTVCHTASRPLNHTFVEPPGNNEAEKEAQIAALKAKNPELFTNKNIWQVESTVWRRYVRRMMAKPGCNISSQEGKQIWEFLVYDGMRRKTGSAAPFWRTHRQELLNRFKAEYPQRYQELIGNP